MPPFIAQTDKAWFDFLSAQSNNGGVDEVNFWSPQGISPLKRMPPGEPVFFRLKSPLNCIAGFGFFAHFEVLGLDSAWELFGIKNGDPDKVRFLQRIGSFRKLDLLDPRSPQQPLGCTILRAAAFWPREKWISWDSTRGWDRNVVRGKTELNEENANLLLNSISGALPAEFRVVRFIPLDVDARRIVLASQVAREGQGTFRARLLSAYEGRCAITGEHTEPVLDAAHIQPYLGPQSNHLQNGLTLTKEFHALFDRGYVTITPEYRVRVSPRLKTDWKNGRRYYPYDNQPLTQIPVKADERPSAAALSWHNSKRFLAAP